MIILFYSNIIYKQYNSKATTNTTTTNNNNNNKQGVIVQTIRNAVINYIVVTIWWIFFTQWCFGLPIMDKIFVLTGGNVVLTPIVWHISILIIIMFMPILYKIGKYLGIYR